MTSSVHEVLGITLPDVDIVQVYERLGHRPQLSEDDRRALVRYCAYAEVALLPQMAERLRTSSAYRYFVEAALDLIRLAHEAVVTGCLAGRSAAMYYKTANESFHIALWSALGKPYRTVITTIISNSQLGPGLLPEVSGEFLGNSLEIHEDLYYAMLEDEIPLAVKYLDSHYQLGSSSLGVDLTELNAESKVISALIDMGGRAVQAPNDQQARRITKQMAENLRDSAFQDALFELADLPEDIREKRRQKWSIGPAKLTAAQRRMRALRAAEMFGAEANEHHRP